MSRPGGWTEWFLDLFLDAADRDEILGDLEEGRRGSAGGRIYFGLLLFATVCRILVSRLFDGVGGDARLALRHLVTDPGYAVLAVTCLALGAGVNAAVFTVADAVIFTPLPYPHGDRLGILSNGHTSSTTGGFGVSLENMRDVAERVPSVEAMALFLDWQEVTYHADSTALRVPATFASHAYFELMGLGARLGRLIGPDENQDGASAPVAVLSHGAWTRIFGSDPGVVGRVLRLNGSPYEVVGVLEDDRGDLRYRWGESPTAIFLPLFAVEPLAGFDLSATRGTRVLNALIRVTPDSSVEHAAAALANISEQLAGEHPEFNKGWVYALQPLRAAFFAPLQTPARALLGGSLLVFLLVVVNLTSLLLIRAEGRVGEVAIRLALGARRWRVGRQLLVESLVLSALAGVLAIVLASSLVALVASTGALELPSFVELRLGLDRYVLAAVSTLFAGVVLGAVATARLLGTVPGGTARDTRRTATSHRSKQVGAALIAAEVSLAFLLLIGAGLLFSSFRTLHATGYGFDTDDLLLARVDLRGTDLTEADVRTFADEAVLRARRLGQVEDAFVWGPNRLGHGNQVEIITRADRWLAFPEERIEASQHHVHPGTLDKLGIRLVSGRDFSPADTAAVDGPSVPQVAIISAAVAAELWPQEVALGSHFETIFRSEVHQVEVIGVVSDSRHRTRLIDPDGPQRDVYYPFDQVPVSTLTLAMRLAPAADVEATANAARRLLNELNPSAPVFELATMGAAMHDEESRHRFSATVVAFYAALALSLAAIGLYGVLAHRVRSQRRELGIRLALGACPEHLRRAVVANGLWPVFVGVLGGAVASIPAGRAIAAFLYGVSAFDPTTYLAVPAALLAISVIALYGPARRAARTSPATALRSD